MADEILPHLKVDNAVKAALYKSPGSARSPVPLERPRREHGEKLLRQIANLRLRESDLRTARIARELPSAVGMTIALEITPKGSLDFKSVDWKRDGVEVLAVTETENSEIVAVHVPDGKLSAFETRVTNFLHKDTNWDKPANASLVYAVENFKEAAFEELWTDNESPPEGEAPFWCQVWLRAGRESPEELHARFRLLALKIGIEVESGYVIFPGRLVVAAFGTKLALTNAATLLDLVAELRAAETTAEYFLAELKPYEQSEWIDDLVARTVRSNGENVPYLTLLDTGVSAHPLLDAHIDDVDKHCVEPSWHISDHDGHGTGMAGIAMYGNLVQAMSSTEPFVISHKLESVKILPPTGETPPHLWGAVTTEAASRVEISKPLVNRVFTMMTTSDGKSAGVPSEWSATVDQLAFGVTRGIENRVHQRLFVLAAGNIPWAEWGDYPHNNALKSIENPAQAWNALTVGACTKLTSIDAAAYPSYNAIAADGDISPCSTTSCLWSTSWPLKPDVVAEGGNASMDRGMVSVGPESLRLLTTSNDLAVPLTETGDTSAATAEVARLAANLRATYPDYWPETIRALVVHGAEYTPAMKATLPNPAGQLEKLALLRTYGYGLIQQGKSISSAYSRPTMVIQKALRPFVKDGASIKMGNLHLQDLPWPADELLALGGAEVQLKVTLSYFIEPNPGKRGWASRYRYQSHGLRFAVKASTETEDAFVARINMLERDGEGEAHNDADVRNWLFGPKVRSRGSIHSDTWVGTAASLATKSQIAVYPVGGWWKDWKDIGRYAEEARYALVVSLVLAEGADVDIYTPIALKIATPVAVPIPS